MDPRRHSALPPCPGAELRPLHHNLPKAVSSLIIQCRTGHVGLNAYLHWRKVPGYPSPLCHCGLAEDTIIHRLTHCPHMPPNPMRPYLTRGGSALLAHNHVSNTFGGDYSTVREVGRWLLTTLPLDQFSWARRQTDPRLPENHPRNVVATDLRTAMENRDRHHTSGSQPLSHTPPPSQIINLDLRPPKARSPPGPFRISVPGLPPLRPLPPFPD